MEVVMIVIIFLIAITIVALIINNIDDKHGYTSNNLKNSLDAIKKEEEEKERKRKADEYAKLMRVKCKVCKNSSMGNFICESCKNKKEIFKKELPKEKTNTYIKAKAYQKELMKDCLYEKEQYLKEYKLLQLLNLDEFLATNYSEYKTNGKDFITKLTDNINKEQIIEYFQLEKINSVNSTNSQNITTTEKTTENFDFRTVFPKPYRCKDGDYVRSKSEREIDDFLFDNRVWHIYEQEYKHPVTGKTAETDFYLPDHNLYIEYFGMTDPEYIHRRDEKIKMYLSDPEINFEYLTYKDDNLIHEKLKRILDKYSIKTK